VRGHEVLRRKRGEGQRGAEERLRGEEVQMQAFEGEARRVFRCVEMEPEEAEQIKQPHSCPSTLISFASSHRMESKLGPRKTQLTAPRHIAHGTRAPLDALAALAPLGPRHLAPAVARALQHRHDVVLRHRAQLAQLQRAVRLQRCAVGAGAQQSASSGGDGEL
jgi:hypothetical protein